MAVKNTTNLADAVYYTLKNKIIRGELKSGTALREENLADSCQVSRTPLRKALTQLMAEGYLIKCNDRTLRIPTISLKELQDLIAARQLLETAAATAAAEMATADDLTRLDNFILDEEEALKVHDTYLVASIDRMFHNYIAKISVNKTYMEFIEQIGYKTSLYLALSDTLGLPINEALKEHKEIVKAIKLKMPDRAAKAMSTHIDNVKDRILASVAKQNSKSEEEKSS